MLHARNVYLNKPQQDYHYIPAPYINMPLLLSLNAVAKIFRAKMKSMSFRLSALLLLLHALLLLPVRCDNDEDQLLQGINSFRQSARAPALAKHDKADCIADEIADKLEDQNCVPSVAPITQTQLSTTYSGVLKKCKVDVNSTADGMILPVCVPHRVATLVLTNYTQSANSRYLNNSRFTGAGIGAEDDWTVLVLTTNTPGGSFVSGGLRLVVGSGCCAAYIVFLMLFLVLM